MSKKKHRASTTSPAAVIATAVLAKAVTNGPGRRREPGERYPSGQLRPLDSRQVGTPGAQVRRIVEMARRGSCDPRLGTAIGWLRLHDVLTDRQFAAAESYSRLRGRHDAVLGLKKRSPASPSYGDALRKGSAVEPTAGRIAKTRSDHEAMIEALVDYWPSGTIVDGKAPRMAARQAQALLDRVCVDDQHPTAWELEALCMALDGLVKHFRI